MDNRKLDRWVEKIQAGNHFAYDDADLRRMLAPIAPDLCKRPELVDVVKVLVDACPPAGMKITYEAAARKLLALME